MKTVLLLASDLLSVVGELKHIYRLLKHGQLTQQSHTSISDQKSWFVMNIISSIAGLVEFNMRMMSTFGHMQWKYVVEFMSIKTKP